MQRPVTPITMSLAGWVRLMASDSLLHTVRRLSGWVRMIANRSCATQTRSRTAAHHHLFIGLPLRPRAGTSAHARRSTCLKCLAVGYTLKRQPWTACIVMSRFIGPSQYCRIDLIQVSGPTVKFNRAPRASWQPGCSGAR